MSSEQINFNQLSAQHEDISNILRIMGEDAALQETETLRRGIDFEKPNNDIVFSWIAPDGSRREMSMEQIFGMIETLENLEQKMESIDYYNNEEAA